MALFDAAFDLTVGYEGAELDLNPNDKGNWTGGAVGAGQLFGSRFGIACAYHPGINPRDLTADQAKAIYKPEYWDAIRGDDLPPLVALVAFDTAVNNGVAAASRWLQMAVGAFVDGNVGDRTVAKAKAADPVTASTDILAHRAVADAGSASFSIDGLGWMRRIASLQIKASYAIARLEQAHA